MAKPIEELTIMDDFMFGAVIRNMDTGETSTEYTKAIDEKVMDVKSDEKERLQYMLLMEAYAMNKNIGRKMEIVNLIRKNLGKATPAFLADFLDITPEETEQYIEAIQEHPDWDDEAVAEYFY